MVTLRADKMNESCAVIGCQSRQDGVARDYPLCPAAKLFVHIINYLMFFMAKLAPSEGWMLGSFFFHLFIDRGGSRSITNEKRTWPISSHLERTLGQ